jgi:asparagine synthetase B (glutamine-hydrolysing)
MASTMAPRGPDAAGVWAHGPVAFGHRRLQIIDLTEAGAQPMIDPELGLAQMFNGFYHRYPILNVEQADARLWRAAGVAYFRAQLTRALDLMGIAVPPRM